MAGFNIVDELSKALGPLKASIYLAGASLVLVMYDWFLTLDDEITLVVPTPRSVVKTLYYIIRVTTLVALLLANYRMVLLLMPSSPLTHRHQISLLFVLLLRTCWIWIILFFQIAITASSSYLMLRRLCPLYGNNRRINLSLHIAFFVTYIVVCILSVYGAALLAPTMNYSPVVDLCSTLEQDKGKAWGSAIFIGPLAFESIVFLMTAWKAYLSATSASHKTMYNSPLHQIFFRDGLIHYVTIMGVRILNIVITYAAQYSSLSPAYLYVALFLLWATISVSTTRLFINLRVVARGGADIWSKADVPILSRFELPHLTRSSHSAHMDRPKIQDIVINVVTETA
ncbi:hypothetical protein FRC17_002770 [Serendipita sp. 399]|nr:hypothetical protein FRC17_002770 [Serendipita sp. 399]